MLDDDDFYAVTSDEAKKLFWKMDRLNIHGKKFNASELSIEIYSRVD